MLEKLYRQYYRELYFYIYSLCGRKSMTEDILQETFLKALMALKDSHTNMRAWMYMVARNLCYNCLKAEKRTVLEEDPERKWEEKRGPGGTDCNDVLEKVLQDERNRDLWQAMDRLSRQKREVLLLQYYGGFGQREIAAMLQMTPENVRVLAFRARKELKSYLEVKNHDIS